MTLSLRIDVSYSERERRSYIRFTSEQGAVVKDGYADELSKDLLALVADTLRLSAEHKEWKQ